MCHPLSWGKQSLLVFFHVYGILFREYTCSFCLVCFLWKPKPARGCQQPAVEFSGGSQSPHCPQVAPLPTAPWAGEQLAQGMSNESPHPALNLSCPLPALPSSLEGRDQRLQAGGCAHASFAHSALGATPGCSRWSLGAGGPENPRGQHSL